MNEREEALELALEVQLTPYQVLDCNPPFTTFLANEARLEHFLILAKQRGADEQKRHDVKLCLESGEPNALGMAFLIETQP